MSLLSVLYSYKVAMLSMQVVFGAKLVCITAMYRFYIVGDETILCIVIYFPGFMF